MRKSRVLVVEVGLALLLNVTAGLLQRPLAIDLAKIGWFILITTILYFVVSDTRVWPKTRAVLINRSRIGGWSFLSVLSLASLFAIWIVVSFGCDRLFA